ncbi:MAG: lamin tail domain-containing protein [Bacteroidales bacterium]|jgi:sodium pump decarboxylase gamma subunit|nr:lamin tail domain-containing protein [Bacteroidales bacterium]
MKKIFSVFTLACLLLLSGGVFAQSPVDIRINEVQVNNVTGAQDENGDRCGWVELFNTAFGMVDVAGFYLTDDQANPTKYMIPKGNTATQVPLRKYFILFADGQPSKGVFHMNFTLDGVKKLYLYSTDGETLLDQIDIPELGPDQSFGRYVDGAGKHEPVNWSKQSARKSSIDSKIAEDGGFSILDHPTPGSTNVTYKVETKSEQMAKMDPWGGILSVTAMGVVFLCLIILYLIFRSIGKRAIKKQEAEKAAKNAPAPTAKAAAIPSDGTINEEIIAAIAIACHLYQGGVDSGIHDVESNVLTFNKDLLRNSPWGARTLTLKQDPRI